MAAMLLGNACKAAGVPDGAVSILCGYGADVGEALTSHKDDATHFSFLAQCKPKGAKILKNEGEADLLCDDAGGRGRGAIHTELKDLIVAYLSANFECDIRFLVDFNCLNLLYWITNRQKPDAH